MNKASGSQRFFISAFTRLARLPSLIIIAFTQYFAGAFLIFSPENIINFITSWQQFILTASSTLIAAGGYIINDYYDVKIDLVQRPENVIIGRHFTRREAILLHLFLSGTGIFLGLILSVKVAALNLISALLLWFYCLFFKRLPFLGNFVIGLLTAMVLWVMMVYYQESKFLLLAYSFFAFGIVLVRAILKDMEDWESEQAFGLKTLPAVFGLPNTKKIIYGLTIIFLTVVFYFAFLLNNYWLLGLFTILLIPISIMLYKLAKADKSHDFEFLVDFSKFIIVVGILSMALV